MTEPQTSTAGNGGGIDTYDPDPSGGWDDSFEIRRLCRVVDALTEMVAAQELRLMELEGRMESSQFIGVSDGFATYIPRNRRGSE